MPLKVAPEDWQNSRGVLASNRYMLDNQVECDVQFVIGTPDGAGVYIPAHSYVLISRSPVFYAMLNGPLAENKNEIRICDVTPEAFNHLLGWVIKCSVGIEMVITFNIRNLHQCSPLSSTY